MNTIKQITLDLLFEAFRVFHANALLESLTDRVHFIGDICLHGGNVFDIALNMLEIKLDEENYDMYFDPFSEVLNMNFKDSQEVKIKIESYYDWLVGLKENCLEE